MIGAFAYLIGVSTRNKLVSQVRRLRNPRYAIAMLLGVGYFWLIFFRRSHANAPGLPQKLDMATFGALLPLALLFVAIYLWLATSDRTAITFTEAEVAFLFPAPVSRRALILYKLARSQAAVITTSLLWVVLFNLNAGVGRGRAGLEHAMTYWALLTTIGMHKLGVALVRASQSEHGVAGYRKTLPAIVAFLAILGALAYGGYHSWDEWRAATDFTDSVLVVQRAVAVPPVSWALYPFHVLIAPIFLPAGASWGYAIIPALALLLLHVLWVLHGDARFEEAAADASAKAASRLAALRTRGVSGFSLGTAAKKRRTYPLAPTGPPAVAIIWKNILYLIRTEQIRSMILAPLICAVAAILFGNRSQTVTVMVLVVCVTLFVILIVFGPMTLRNDLRMELGRIPMLKSLPLPGKQIILAEVTSSALPTAVSQFLLVIAGMIALGFLPHAPSAELRIGIVLGAPLLLMGLNLANFTVHNALALMFPAWVKVGGTGVNGIEAIGQTMLTMIITLFMLTILLLVPAAIGAVSWFMYSTLPIVALVGAGGSSGMVLAAEAWGVMTLLGGSLERLEPSAV